MKATSPGPVERRLALEEADLGLRKRVLDERERLDGAEQEDVAVLAGEEEPRPRRAALLVLRPLDLVEHEHLAAQRRHLGGAADDRRVLVDPLLAGDEADALGAELRDELAMRLLRQHPQRRREDPAPGLGEELERRVRLAGVRRAEVGDHGLGLGGAGRKPDLRLGQARDVALLTRPALRSARSLLAAAAVLPAGGQAQTFRKRRMVNPEPTAPTVIPTTRMIAEM